MRNTILRAALMLVTWVLTGYLIHAFIEWDWGVWGDIGEWPRVGRALWFLAVIAAGAVFAAPPIFYGGDER